MFFEEITASSLIKVDSAGNLLGESDYPVNPAGFVIHGAIHMSGDDRHCVLHTHSRYGTAVAMQKNGLLPVSQKALTIMGWVGYHDFEGPAVDESEQPRIVKDIEGKSILILRNHGLLSVGKTVGEAFVYIYRIETACRHQIDAMSGGAELQTISPADAAQIHRHGAQHVRPRRIHRGWQGMADVAPSVTACRHGRLCEVIMRGLHTWSRHARSMRFQQNQNNRLNLCDPT